MTAITERRNKARNGSARLNEVKLTLPERPGVAPASTMPVQVINVTANGIGLRLPSPIPPAVTVTISGLVTTDEGERTFSGPARAAWCVPLREGGFRAGFAFKNPDTFWMPPQDQQRQQQQGQQQSQQEQRSSDSGWSAGAREESKTADGASANNEADLYEMLQVSAKADFDTIHRIYRILAQRYHPDNRETGSDEAFRAVQHAYETLSNPERRAAYDVRRAAASAYRIQIFSKPADTEGIDGERRKRRGVLLVLYTQRMNDSLHPGMSINHIEELLGVPREHMEFALWYLREQNLMTRTDNGRYAITAKGVDDFEAWSASAGENQVIRHALLTAPAPVV